MLKWLLALVIVSVILSVLLPRSGFGNIPGDLRIPVRGRVLYIPIASTLVFSLLVWALAKLL